MTVVTWQWLRSDDRDEDYKPIPGATTDTYVPWKKAPGDDEDIDDDDSMFLRVVATYLDATSADDSSSTGNVDERVQDKGDDPDVSDALDPPTAKTATMTSTGDGDSRLFRVAKTSDNAVRVADVSADDMPVFTDAPYDREVAENAESGSVIGVPVMAVYEDKIKYSIDPNDANDNKYFDIDPYSGQIRVGTMRIPSPAPAGQFAHPTDGSLLVGKDSDDAAEATATDPVLDFEGKNTFTIVITAADANDSGKKATAEVAVSLVDLNEAPYFDKESREKVMTRAPDTGVSGVRVQNYAENRRTSVVALAAIEPDGASLDWELTGDDAGAFDVVDIADGAGNRDRVELAFKKQPNHESKAMYAVTVRATEESTVGDRPAMAASLDVEVNIVDVEEPGKVEVKWLQPEVETPLPVILSDPDGTPTGVTYVWYRAKVSSPDANPDLDKIDLDTSQWEKIGTSTTSDSD